jgi:hypothetical protein
MARSNNNNKLKAFVRFDGSGRIVPSSLIVQAFKPKVGNWQEIDAKECCNYTTTTTTTIAPTTTTTTTVAFYEWFLNSGENNDAACNAAGDLVHLYSSETPLALGVILYTNSGLTTPVANGFYADTEGVTSYQVTGGAGEITSETLCGA